MAFIGTCFGCVIARSDWIAIWFRSNAHIERAGWITNWLGKTKTNICLWRFCCEIFSCPIRVQLFDQLKPNFYLIKLCESFNWRARSERLQALPWRGIRLEFGLPEKYETSLREKGDFGRAGFFQTKTWPKRSLPDASNSASHPLAKHSRATRSPRRC